ncbi:hypothetical protein B0H21DRAFT_752505 [Amylocystis lapponica]|nr:hypothetical protein B0H21DRAFT_752505 [Amylocystis lapponica]
MGPLMLALLVVSLPVLLLIAALSLSLLGIIAFCIFIAFVGAAVLVGAFCAVVLGVVLVGAFCTVVLDLASGTVHSQVQPSTRDRFGRPGPGSSGLADDSRRHRAAGCSSTAKSTQIRGRRRRSWQRYRWGGVMGNSAVPGFHRAHVVRFVFYLLSRCFPDIPLYFLQYASSAV